MTSGSQAATSEPRPDPPRDCDPAGCTVSRRRDAQQLSRTGPLHRSGPCGKGRRRSIRSSPRLRLPRRGSISGPSPDRLRAASDRVPAPPPAADTSPKAPARRVHSRPGDELRLRVQCLLAQEPRGRAHGRARCRIPPVALRPASDAHVRDPSLPARVESSADTACSASICPTGSAVVSSSISRCSKAQSRRPRSSSTTPYKTYDLEAPAWQSLGHDPRVRSRGHSPTRGSQPDTERSNAG